MSKITNQKIVEFLYKNSWGTSFLSLGIFFYFSFFHQVLSEFRSELFLIYFFLIYLMTFLFRRFIGRVYDEVVVAYKPTKIYHNYFKKQVLLFLFAILVIVGYFHFMKMLPRGYEGLGILIHVLLFIGFPIIVLIYALPKLYSANKAKAGLNFFIKIILTKSQLIVYYTHQRIAKYNLNQLEFDWQKK